MASKLTDDNLQALNRISRCLLSGALPHHIFCDIYEILKQETGISGLYISGSTLEAQQMPPAFFQIQDTHIAPEHDFFIQIQQWSQPTIEKGKIQHLAKQDLPPCPPEYHDLAIPGNFLAYPLFNGEKPAGVMAVFSEMPLNNAWQALIENISMMLSLYFTKSRIFDEKEALQNYLFNIINSMPSILIVVDKSTRVTQWNFQAELETGIHESDAIGKPVAVIFPRLARYTELIKESVRFNRIKTRLRQRYTSEEITRFEDIIIYPLLTLKDEGVVIRMDDITEQVRMEEMMIQSEKMLSIGGLAAGMAHEINNPLAGMMQNAQVIFNRLNNNIPANIAVAEEMGIPLSAIREYAERRQLFEKLDLINETGTRAAEIIRNMLGFARKSDTVFDLNNLSEIIEKTLKLIRHDYNLANQYDFKLIRVNRDFETDMPPVLCDKNKIQQVLFNLFKNGSEAMFSGDPHQTRPEFTIRLYSEKKKACIEVENNGPAIKEKEQKRLFEPFFTTKPAGKGTGLGLSLSYFIIVNDHKGEMSVETTPNGNTRFLVKLPY